MAAPSTLPMGCRVVAGRGAITQADDLTLTITQSTPTLAVECSSFDVAPGAAVVFRQPAGGQAVATVTVMSGDGSAGAVRHQGTLTAAAGGRVVLKAGQIESAGRIEAPGGEIVLQSSQTTLLARGSRTSAAGEGQGGRIHLLGAQVGVADGAVVDASGGTGGGTILVGGDYQGRNPAIANAEAVYVGADAVLQADAVRSGDGGRVIVWSDRATRSYGRISVQGGAEGGNGGLVENSSGKGLDFHARVDVGAVRGQTGTLLLDPSTITIVGGTGDGDSDGTAIFAGNPSGTSGTVVFSDTGPTTVYQSELQGLSGNIILQATDYISAAGAFIGSTLLLSPGTNLTLSTRNGATDGTGTKGIDLTTSASGVNLIIQAQGGNVTMQTGTGASPQAADIGIGPVITGGGALTMNASGNVTTRGVSTASVPNPGGNVGITASGSISVGASIDTHGYMAQPGGAITLTAGGPVAAQGSASLIGNSLNANAAGGIYSGAGTGPVQTQLSSLYAANSGSGTINIANSGGNLAVTGMAQSAPGGGVAITNTTSGYSVALTGAVSTQGGPITLTADVLSLGGGTLTTNDSTSPITLAPYTNARPIDLGGTTGSGLQLSTSSLGSALPSNAKIVIGKASAGDITVDGWPVSLASVSLGLVTGGAVTQTAALAAGTLSVDAGGSVTLTSASNSVGTLGAVTAASFSLNNGGHAIALGNGFTLNLSSAPAVGDVFTLVSNAGAVTGTLNSPAVTGLAVGETARFSYPSGKVLLTIGGPATQLSINTPGTANTGAAFNATVTALDAAGNLVASYTGTVHFSSTDGSAALPADSTLTNGTQTFSVTLNTVGNRTVTAADTVNSLSITSGTIAVSGPVVPTAAPTGAAAVGGDGSARVTWTPVPSATDSTITGYVVTAQPGGATCTANGASAGSCLFSNLSNGTAYTFTVAAKNAVGTGTATASAGPVTPAKLQAAGLAVPGGGTASVVISGGQPGCSLSGVPQFSGTIPSGAPANATFPAGAFSFNAAGGCTGTLTVSITYSNALPANVQLQKYGPQNTGAPNTWFAAPSATLSPDRKTVSYTIADNGPGDSDAAVGQVADPFVPLVLPAGAEGIPTLREWGLVVLSALAGLLGLGAVRRRTAMAGK